MLNTKSTTINNENSENNAILQIIQQSKHKIDALSRNHKESVQEKKRYQKSFEELYNDFFHSIQRYASNEIDENTKKSIRSHIITMKILLKQQKEADENVTEQSNAVSLDDIQKNITLLESFVTSLRNKKQELLDAQKDAQKTYQSELEELEDNLITLLCNLEKLEADIKSCNIQLLQFNTEENKKALLKYYNACFSDIPFLRKMISILLNDVVTSNTIQEKLGHWSIEHCQGNVERLENVFYTSSSYLKRIKSITQLIFGGKQQNINDPEQKSFNTVLKFYEEQVCIKCGLYNAALILFETAKSASYSIEALKDCEKALEIKEAILQEISDQIAITTQYSENRCDSKKFLVINRYIDKYINEDKEQTDKCKDVSNKYEIEELIYNHYRIAFEAIDQSFQDFIKDRLKAMCDLLENSNNKEYTEQDILKHLKELNKLEKSLYKGMQVFWNAIKTFCEKFPILRPIAQFAEKQLNKSSKNFLALGFVKETKCAMQVLKENIVSKNSKSVYYTDNRTNVYPIKARSYEHLQGVFNKLCQEIQLNKCGSFSFDV